MAKMLKCISCGKLHNPNGYYVTKENKKCLTCGSEMVEFEVEDATFTMDEINRDSKGNPV